MADGRGTFQLGAVGDAVLLDAADRHVTRRGSAIGFVLTSLLRSYVEFARGALLAAEVQVGAASSAEQALPDRYLVAPAVVAAAVDVQGERGALSEAETLAASSEPAGSLPDSTPHGCCSTAADCYGWPPARSPTRSPARSPPPPKPSAPPRP